VEGMGFVLTLKYRSKSYTIKVQNSFRKRNTNPERELELNATLTFSLSDVSFSRTCNYCNNDILTLSLGINSLQLIQIDLFDSHL